MKLDSPEITYLGCSAGALAAVGIVLNGDFDKAVEFCKEDCIPQLRESPFFGLFRLSEYVSACLELYLLPNFKEIPVGHLQVAVTRLPFLTQERIMKFSSKDDLKQVLLASSAAYPFASLVKLSNNSYYVDGGITDFQPIIDDNTLTVSPFYFSDTDIKPSRLVAFTVQRITTYLIID